MNETSAPHFRASIVGFTIMKAEKRKTVNPKGRQEADENLLRLEPK